MKNKHSQEWHGIINYAIITTSDSRTFQTDMTGSLIKKILTNAFTKKDKIKTECKCYEILKNDKTLIRKKVKKFINDKSINLIITSGGTGISRKDVTVEAVRPLIEKELVGFGEAFRTLSFKEVGTRAFLTRCLCGIVKNKIVLCLPGSPNAYSLALKKLLVPEIRHIYNMLE